MHYGNAASSTNAYCRLASIHESGWSSGLPAPPNGRLTDLAIFHGFRGDAEGLQATRNSYAARFGGTQQERPGPALSGSTPVGATKVRGKNPLKMGFCFSARLSSTYHVKLGAVGRNVVLLKPEPSNALDAPGRPAGADSPFCVSAHHVIWRSAPLATSAVKCRRIARGISPPRMTTPISMLRSYAAGVGFADVTRAVCSSTTIVFA